MAEADRVVVELIAQTEQFDAKMKASASTFDRSMGDIQRSAGGATGANAALRVALNDNRVAMTGLAGGSSLATRELLVLAREASRGPGNFARMAGSATILSTALQGSGQSITGLVGNLLTMFGVIKKTTDADLALAAADSAAAAEHVAAAAKKAAAAVAAADTEVALAEAQLRVTEGTSAESAAQIRLAEAHQAVAAAAADAVIAEDALGVAQARAGEAGAAAAAKSVLGLGRLGTAAVVAAPALLLTYGAVKSLQEEVDKSGALDKFAESLGLTTKEMKKLREEVGGLSAKEMQDLSERAKAFGLTWGDVFHGLEKDAEDAFNLSPAWARFKEGTADAYSSALKFAVDFAAGSYGAVVGGIRAMEDIWHTVPAAIGDAFYSGVNVAIGAIDKLLQASTDGVNKFIGAVNSINPFHQIGTISAPQIAQVGNAYAGAGKAAGAAFSTSFGKESAKATAEARAQIQKNLGTIYADILGAAESRIKSKADAILADRTPKKPKKAPGDHGLQEALDELDAQIEGQKRLAAAYSISDAAVIKAEALQKAEEQAIRHKGEIGVFYEKELALAIAKGEAENAKKISGLEQETAARKKINDAVESGLIPASQANDALKLETELRPLLAEYEAADAAGKKVLGAQIRALTTDQAALNDQIARETALRQIASNDDEIAKLKLEKDLIGASNRERAVALAQLEAEQFIKNNNITDAKAQADTIQSYIDKANASYLSPFEQWAQSVPRTADAVNEAVRSVAVGGLKSFAAGIADAVVNFKNLGDVAKSVLKSIASQLIEMAVQRLFVNALGGLFGGGGFGSKALLNVPAPISSGLINAPAIAPGVGFRAAGGPVGAGQPYVVGEDGPELFVPASSGRIIPSNAVAAAPGGGGSRGVVHVVIEASPYFDGRVMQVSGPVIAQASVAAAQGGASIGRRNLGKESMHRLE